METNSMSDSFLVEPEYLLRGCYYTYKEKFKDVYGVHSYKDFVTFLVGHVEQIFKARAIGRVESNTSRSNSEDSTNVARILPDTCSKEPCSDQLAKVKEDRSCDQKCYQICNDGESGDQALSRSSEVDDDDADDDVEEILLPCVQPGNEERGHESKRQQFDHDVINRKSSHSQTSENNLSTCKEKQKIYDSRESSESKLNCSIFDECVNSPSSVSTEPCVMDSDLDTGSCDAESVCVFDAEEANVQDLLSIKYEHGNDEFTLKLEREVSDISCDDDMKPGDEYVIRPYPRTPTYSCRALSQERFESNDGSFSPPLLVSSRQYAGSRTRNFRWSDSSCDDNLCTSLDRNEVSNTLPPNFNGKTLTETQYSQNMTCHMSNDHIPRQGTNPRVIGYRHCSIPNVNDSNISPVSSSRKSDICHSDVSKVNDSSVSSVCSKTSDISTSINGDDIHNAPKEHIMSDSRINSSNQVLSSSKNDGMLWNVDRESQDEVEMARDTLTAVQELVDDVVSSACEMNDQNENISGSHANTTEARKESDQPKTNDATESVISIMGEERIDDREDCRSPRVRRRAIEGKHDVTESGTAKNTDSQKVRKSLSAETDNHNSGCNGYDVNRFSNDKCFLDGSFSKQKEVFPHECDSEVPPAMNETVHKLLDRGTLMLPNVSHEDLNDVSVDSSENRSKITDNCAANVDEDNTPGGAFSANSENDHIQKINLSDEQSHTCDSLSNQTCHTGALTHVHEENCAESDVSMIDTKDNDQKDDIVNRYMKFGDNEPFPSVDFRNIFSSMRCALSQKTSPVQDNTPSVSETKTYVGPYIPVNRLQSLPPKGRYCVCEVCNKLFRSRRDLVVHKGVHMIKNGKRPFSCELCPRSYSARQALVSHIRVNHNGGNKLFSCSVTGCSFTAERQLRVQRHEQAVHKIIYTNLDKYACQYCEKRFVYKQSRDVHVRSHTGERPYVCQYCGNSYSDAGTLRRHNKRTHSNVRPIHCYLCDKPFIYEYDLRRHLDSHAGVRPFSCDLCLRRFTQKAHLRKHERCIHGKTRTDR